MIKLIQSLLFIFIFSFIFLTCFPDKKAVHIRDSLEIGNLKIIHPTKIFLNDASQILLPNGFVVENNILKGTGVKYDLNGSMHQNRLYNLSLDSINAMTYYELESSSASSFASFLLVVYGSFFFPVSIYCIACPKCCFGSCPTVYAGDSLQAELFSYSISRYFQETDLDKIFFNPDDEFLKIRVANEALETHYINQLELIQVCHPEGTNAYPTGQDSIVIVEDILEPINAKNSAGQDILPIISKSDKITYRSDSLFASRLKQNKVNDWIEIEIDPENASDRICLFLKLRNTLLTTVLFYDLVLESQGILAIDWTAKMQNDYMYAKIFNEIYQKFAGIRFYVYEHDTWIYKTRIGDVGPIAWKDIAVEIPCDNVQGKIKIRLEFFPDNFMIDYLGYSNQLKDKNQVDIAVLEPQDVITDDNKQRIDIISAINASDNNYLVSYPGQSCYLSFKPVKTDAQRRSFFLKSKGYYIEWLRGNWISSENKPFKFNLFDPDATISYLYERWQLDRPLLEKEFFKNRIPLRESL